MDVTSLHRSAPPVQVKRDRCVGLPVSNPIVPPTLCAHSNSQSNISELQLKASAAHVISGSYKQLRTGAVQRTLLSERKVGSNLLPYSCKTFHTNLVYSTSAPLVPGAMSHTMNASFSS